MKGSMAVSMMYVYLHLCTHLDMSVCIYAFIYIYVCNYMSFNIKLTRQERHFLGLVAGEIKL